jgi:hypothetical protein
VAVAVADCVVFLPRCEFGRGQVVGRGGDFHRFRGS